MCNSPVRARISARGVLLTCACCAAVAHVGDDQPQLTPIRSPAHPEVVGFDVPMDEAMG